MSDFITLDHAIVRLNGRNSSAWATTHTTELKAMLESARWTINTAIEWIESGAHHDDVAGLLKLILLEQHQVETLARMVADADQAS